MKILNILFNYKKATHDNQILGVERCFIDYSQYLTQFGHDVGSVIKSGIMYVDAVKQTGSKVYEMQALGSGDIFTMLKMTYLFCKFKPDVVLCHSKRALYFSRIARFLTWRKVPIIVINHGIRVKKFLKADYVFAVNNYFTNLLIKAGMPTNRAIAIPNMIEMPENFVAPIKPKFRKPLRIGSLGRLYPEKYFDKVLYAMKILQNKDFECNYVIGGVGPEQSLLENLACEFGLKNNFKILGWIENKVKFFDEIDIFILPSWGETFGIVLLEAMLYNTPIITSDSWGPQEIIDHEIDGLKVSRIDDKKMPELLAEAILKLNNDQEFAKKLAKNAHKKFLEKYEANVVARQLERLLAGIVAKKL
ncbi:MAG TPA: glycosyltransferase family 4 protein [Rickettsiales bacterium]|nr:glycosyltransferase family 4 protein [Rickettsiales bacterium]